MPTERKRAIRTAGAWSANQAAMESLYGVGGYYTSLSLWEAGEQANLTALDEIRTAVCYNDWPTGLADELDINGWTTDATRYVRVTVAEGHRHNGVPKSGFYMQKTSTATTLLFVRHSYTVIEWIDCEQLGGSKFSVRNLSGTGSKYIKVLAKNLSTNAAFCFDSGADVSCIQCLAYDSPIGFGRTNGQGFKEVLGCIAANISGTGFGAAGGSTVAKNCIAYNCGTDYREVGFSSVNSSNNASTSATDTCPGSGSVTGITSAAFVDAANNDFHLSSGSVLRGAGVNLYSDFQTDIDGDTWPSSGAWDIGFDYYVEAGGALTIDSITASNITQTGATITLGVTR